MISCRERALDDGKRKKRRGRMKMRRRGMRRKRKKIMRKSQTWVDLGVSHVLEILQGHEKRFAEVWSDFWMQGSFGHCR